MITFLERGKLCARVVDVRPVRSAAGLSRTVCAAGAARKPRIARASQRSKDAGDKSPSAMILCEIEG
jgi:hypothetical protein